MAAPDTDTQAAKGQPTKDEASKEATRPLDDVMIAMDVVDTLRHDKRLVERELNVEGRKAELIDELRKIYKNQGIEVPDRILEDGVKALEEKRFVYTPPPTSLEVRLARLYVTRKQWGRPALAAITGAIMALGGWWAIYERPRAIEQAAQKQELEQDLPKRLDSLLDQVTKETSRPALAEEAKRLAESSRSAARGGQLEPARTGATQLQRMLDEIRRDYDIRIINRQGEVTGLWRVPKVNPGSRNYYLVVEAVERAGKTIPRDILNEETGQRETVVKWAVRVPKSVFDAIQADKQDDGIIQKAVLGTKARGDTEPQWRLEVSGGALTRW